MAINKGGSVFDPQHPSSIGLLFDRVQGEFQWSVIDSMFGDRFFALDGTPIRRDEAQQVIAHD